MNKKKKQAVSSDVAFSLELPLTLRILCFISRSNGVSAKDCAEYCNLTIEAARQQLRYLLGRDMIVSYNRKGSKLVSYRIAKEGVNAIVRVRSFADTALRVRRDTFESHDPELVKAS